MPVRHTAWFIEVHLQAYISRSNHIQKLIVLIKISFKLLLVSTFSSFLVSSLMFLCSYITKGISSTETVVYRQEFLVKDSDLTSPISQHGTKAEKMQLIKSIAHAKNEETLISSLNSLSVVRSPCSLSLKIRGLFVVLYK